MPVIGEPVCGPTDTIGVTPGVGPDTPGTGIAGVTGDGVRSGQNGF